jgi:hypothetical protein
MKVPFSIGDKADTIAGMFARPGTAARWTHLLMATGECNSEDIAKRSFRCDWGISRMLAPGIRNPRLKKFVDDEVFGFVAIFFRED